jgi:hypothetical protein
MLGCQTLDGLTTSLLDSYADHEGGGVGQHDPRHDGGPACEARVLQAEEPDQAKHPANEALNAGALAQLVGSLGGWEAIAPLLPLGVPGNNSHRSQRSMDPGDQLEAIQQPS